jgi:hypothetical protein
MSADQHKQIGILRRAISPDMKFGFTLQNGKADQKFFKIFLVVLS